MRRPSDRSHKLSFHERVLAQANLQLGRAYRWDQQLDGGEQSGAHLVSERDQSAVLKWERDADRAEQLMSAFQAVQYATDRGWSAARWLGVGPIDGGGAFVLQEHVEGTAMTALTVEAVQAVLVANTTQKGLAFTDASDDSAQLEAVLRGDHPWKLQVAAFTAAGAALTQQGDDVAAWAADVAIPTTDAVHGDYSSSNILLDHTASRATLVDSQTIARGSRVRDLADLYRQSAVYPDASNKGAELLRSAGVAIGGPQLFAKCAVAVTYNNLAWWVDRKSPDEFDQACSRLLPFFESLSSA